LFAILANGWFEQSLGSREAPFCLERGDKHAI
jgi:hypothetical protein